MNKHLQAQRYRRSCKMLRAMIEENVPQCMVINEARLLLI